jgi:putative alpha-1,2-mannosidase
VQGHAAMNPTFQFGSPLFDKVTIALDPKYYSGKALVIEAQHNNRQNKYVQGVSFNNEAIQDCWIDRKRLMQGGTLLFKMGSQPDTNWGRKTPPPSMSTDKK